MGMAAILFNGAKPFEQIVNIPSTEGPMWSLKKMGQAVSEKKMFKDFMILYLYRAQEQGQISKFQPLSLKYILKKMIFQLPIQIYRDTNLTLPYKG